MARDIFDTFAAHASLVLDSSGTDCWALNGSTITTTTVVDFYRVQVSLCNKWDGKSNIEKMVCVYVKRKN